MIQWDFNGMYPLVSSNMASPELLNGLINGPFSFAMFDYRRVNANGHLGDGSLPQRERGKKKKWGWVNLNDAVTSCC